MPLDGHSYLVAQGWSGKGTGLRQGAIARPITVSQKKTLSGIGKDRDEAFPFWDHLFSAAAKAITVKIDNSSDEDDSDDDRPAPLLRRTTTGILSNQRPPDGTPVTSESSGANTPIPSTAPRMSLLTAAKREAARRGLYSKFFRGPVLGPDPTFAQPSTPVMVSSSSSSRPSAEEAKTSSKAKSKSKDVEEKSLEKEDKAAKRQRKAEKRERKEMKRLKREAKAADAEEAERKRRKKEAKALARVEDAPVVSDDHVVQTDVKKRRRKVDDPDAESSRKKKRKRELKSNS